MIQDGPANDNTITDGLQARIQGIVTAVEQVSSPHIFDPAGSTLTTIPLGSESRQRMQQLGKEELEKFERFKAKIARMQTDTGAPQYLLAPDLSEHEVAELIALLKAHGLVAESLLVELSDCLRRNAKGEHTSQVLVDWSRKTGSSFGMHHLLGFLAGAQHCQTAVSHADVGGWSWPLDEPPADFPNDLHGIASFDQRVSALEELLGDSTLKKQAHPTLARLAAAAPDGKPAKCLRQHDWQAARSDLDVDDVALANQLKHGGIAVLKTFDSGVWTIDCKHAGKSLPVEAPELIAQHLGIQCAVALNPGLTAACVRFLSTDAMKAAGPAFSEALCKYGPPASKWWTPELVEVVAQWFRHQPVEPMHVDYLVELCKLACANKSYDSEVLEAVGTLSQESAGGDPMRALVLVRLAGDESIAEPTRLKALHLLFDYQLKSKDQQPHVARLLRLAARNNLADKLLGVVAGAYLPDDFAATVLTPGAYPYNIAALGDKTSNSFRRLLEKERILMRADALLKEPSDIKLEWPDLLADCCHLVRGVGFDRPVVQLLCELFLLQSNGNIAFNALEDAARHCKSPAFRLEAWALLAAVWGGGSISYLAHAIEAVWPAPAQDGQPGFETTYLLTQLHRSNAALHLQEPRLAVHLVLGVCESIIWLAGTKPKVLLDRADTELPLVAYLHQTLNALVSGADTGLDKPTRELLVEAADAMTRLAKASGQAVAAVPRIK